MNSEILIKINNFIKNRLIELLGFLLVFISIFILASIVSYSPSDPNFIYTPENTEIKNIGGFYGSVISDFLLQSLGLVSIFLVFNFFYWGIKIAINKKVVHFVTRIFYTLAYIVFGTTVLNIFHNDSFLLIDNGNGGFVGRILRENIYYFTPLIENLYVNYVLILLTIIFFILSLSIKISEIIKILIFPFLIIKKIKKLLNKDKKISHGNMNISNVQLEKEHYEETEVKEKQPILPFSKKKVVKSSENNFKLPLINFLEKNPDLKSKKNIADTELRKKSES